MAFGAIKKIRQDDGSETWSGELIDLETKKEYRFLNQKGLDTVNRYDVVSYVEQQGLASDLLPNIKVRLENYDTAAPEVQTEVQLLLLKMAKDKNMTDVVAKKV